MILHLFNFILFERCMWVNGNSLKKCFSAKYVCRVAKKECRFRYFPIKMQCNIFDWFVYTRLCDLHKIPILETIALWWKLKILFKSKQYMYNRMRNCSLSFGAHAIFLYCFHFVVRQNACFIVDFYFIPEFIMRSRIK